MGPLFVAAVLIGILLIIIISNIHIVPQSKAYLVERLGAYHQTWRTGIHFKIPFIDTVKYFTKATQLYDIPPSEVLTSDKQNMTVDCYILWKIDDPQQFYRALGTTAKAEDRLDSITYGAVKREMGKLAQADIINMEDGALRNEIYEGIATIVSESAKTYGIIVEDVKIKQFDLPESNLNAVYQRMISERNQMAEKFTADGDKEANLIINEVNKIVNITISNAEAEAAKLIAEGEAEYMRMLAEAYDTEDKKDFYEFTLALDALMQSLTGGEKTIILDADSDLAEILMGVN